MSGSLVPLAKREKLRLGFSVNGEARDLVVASYKTLLEVLREDLGLTRSAPRRWRRPHTPTAT